MRLLVRAASARFSFCTLMLAVAAVLAATPLPAHAQSDEEKRITDSAAVLETLVRAPDQDIPDYIL